jgi:cytochrome c biogenesis protein CcmG, thiol:disulfide interchange protein DsbE
MSEIDESTEPATEPTPDAPEPRPARRRGLGIGPLGLFLITAIALLAAGLAARAVLEALDDDPVDIQEMLDESAKAPLVTDTESRAEVGQPAPDVRLEYLDGGVQQLSEVAGTGTPVVLNFWSSTCVPCLNEMPAIEQVHDELDGKVTVVGIDVTDTEDAGTAMVAKTGVTYRNARDPRSEIFALFGGIALPRTVLIDADGKVVDTHSGELTADELRSLLDEHDLLPA